VNTQYESVQKLIEKDLELSNSGTVFIKLDKLNMWLAGEIRILLDRDFNQLMNILYRIDVSEEKVKKAFAADDPAFSIAGLIIERELKKVESRSKYSDPE
jgi:hypothetical protein